MADAKNFLEGCTVTYFDLAGRAEVPRLLLSHGGIKFTDQRIKKEEWPALKPTTPFGGLPVLTLANGTQISQSIAIARLIARVVGLYQDPVSGALQDQIIDGLTDVMTAIFKIGAGLKGEELKAARTAALADESNSVNVGLRNVDALLGQHGSRGFCVGDSVTLADYHLFVASNTLASGFFDGVTGAILAPHANIQAVRKQVGSSEPIQAYYKDRTDPASVFFKSVAATIVLPEEVPAATSE